MSKASHDRRAAQTGKSHSASSATPKRAAKSLDFYLSSAILVLACFILFLPLVVNYDFYYPYIFLKSILFRVAVQAMTLLYVILAVRYPGYRPRLNRLSGALIAYFGVMLVASLPFISLSAWKSWWGEFARMGGIFTQLHLLAYFYILVQVIKRERDWLVLFTASLFFCTIMVLSGMIQLLGLDFVYRFRPEDRLQGAAGNTLWFASLMVLNFFIVIWFLSRNDRQEAYSIAAKCWLILLVVLDLFVTIWEVSGAGPGSIMPSSEFAFFPVIVFALALHAISLCWFFLRRSVAFGICVFGTLGCTYLYWLYQCQSRSSAIGLVAALALMMALYILTGTGKRMRWVGAGLLLVILLVPSAIWLKRASPWVQSHPALQRLTRISREDFMAGRYWPWKAATRAMMDHPVLGWGLENYSNAFDRHFPPQVINTWESMPWFDRAHNIFLDIGTTTGFLGLAVYLVFYGLVFYYLIRRWFRTKDPARTLVAAALLMAYLIMGLATFDIVNTDVVLYPLLAYVAWLYQREQDGASPVKSHQAVQLRPSRAGQLSVAAAAVVVLLAFWYVAKEPYQSNLLLNQAIQSTKVYDSQKRTEHLVYGREIRDLFKRANDYQTTGRFEVREELANYASQLAEATDAPIEERRLAAGQAIDFLRESIKQEPENARNFMYFASLVNRCLGVIQSVDPNQARDLAKQSLEALQTAEGLSPTRPQLYFEQGKAFAYLSRYEDQVAAIEKGMVLNPPIAGARYFDAAVKEPNLNLLVAYIGAEKYDKADGQWDKLKTLSITLTPSEYDRIIALYATKKQYPTIVRLRQEQLKANPNDAQVLAGLATAYREMGELELARQTALKAASLSPQSEAAIQAFLESLKNHKSSGN